jgi:hypothetical protein
LLIADAIGPANISHNSGQRIIRVFSASLSGDRGRTAAAAEGPWSCPSVRSLQGLSQTLDCAVSEHHPLQLEARLNKLIDHVSSRRINIDEPTYVRKIPHVRTSTDEDERYSN